jgi:hypothetical protein
MMPHLNRLVVSRRRRGVQGFASHSLAGHARMRRMIKHRYARWVILGLCIGLLGLATRYLWVLQRRVTSLEIQAATIRHDFALDLRFNLDRLEAQSKSPSEAAARSDAQWTQLNVVKLESWLYYAKSASERYSFYFREPPLDFALGQILGVYDSFLITVQDDLLNTPTPTPLLQQQLTALKDDFSMLSTLFPAEVLDRGDGAELNLQLATWCSRIQLDVARQNLRSLTLCP